MTERWLPVIGYEGLYEVSDLGRARSVTRIVQGRDGRTRAWQGRVLKQYTGNRGYPQVGLSRGGKIKTRLVYRLVLEAFTGTCPEGQEARHGPGGKTDSSLANLCWGTRSQNVGADRLRDSQDNGGDRNGSHKLTREAVDDIRHRWDAVMSIPHHPWTGGPLRDDLAREYGVSAGNIWLIVTRRSWR